MTFSKMNNLKKYTHWLPLLVAFGLSAALFWATPGLSPAGQRTLMVFVFAIVGWSFTTIDATVVAIGAALLMWALGLTQGQLVLSGLGDSFIGFVIAGFMLGGAYKLTGLSGQLAQWFGRRAHRVSDLFYWLTLALVVLSFVIPATSARAALMLPIYTAVSAQLPSAGARKGLAVLFPVIIVLSCVTSYLGAGANLLTASYITSITGEKISYVQWLVLGGPIGIVSCGVSAWAIVQLFLTKAERDMPLRAIETEPAPVHAGHNRRLGIVTVVLLVLWMTEPLHHLDAGMVALAGALVLCIPQTGVMTLKHALKEVEWSLVLFMAATLELSHALINNGVVAYCMALFKQMINGWSGETILVVVLAAALVSHLLIHSRTARAAVLLPLLVPISMSAGHSGLLVAFFANAAMGYCITLPICAKPVALFSTAGGDGYTSGDLMRLSAWLLPFHLVLFVAAYWFYRFL